MAPGAGERMHEEEEALLARTALLVGHGRERERERDDGETEPATATVGAGVARIFGYTVPSAWALLTVRAMRSAPMLHRCWARRETLEAVSTARAGSGDFGRFREISGDLSGRRAQEKVGVRSACVWGVRHIGRGDARA